jgi:Family of unknown function (DUF6350)
MAARRDAANERRSVVPQAAGRSLWLAAAWTGAGAAIVCAVIAIAVVAICWLPAANGSGSGASAIRAGILTFLAALHGGITVDGLPSAFVPFGMTLLVAGIAWRAGRGLADAARQLGEIARGSLVRAAVLQTVVFAAVCGVAAQLSRLGTSHVSVFAAVFAGFLLFAVTGAVAFVRSSPLLDELREWTPGWLGPAVRAAASGLAVYLGAGALLVAGSLIVHHGRVEALSSQVGGGWSGVPILLLGVFAAPNAAIAGASYLAGPGFAVGTGSGVALGSTVHGTLPAFPVLGAVPSGPATTPVWLLTAVTPAIAGACVARAVSAEPSWLLRLRTAGAGGVIAAVFGMVLGWQGGGAIGSGRLSAFGASPWQFGLAAGAAMSIVAAASIGALQALAWWRARAADRVAEAGATLAAVLSVADDAADGDDAEADVLAG